MLKHLIALVVIALAAAVRFAGSCPDPSNDQCRYAHLHSWRPRLA